MQGKSALAESGSQAYERAGDVKCGTVHRLTLNPKARPRSARSEGELDVVVAERGEVLDDGEADGIAGGRNHAAAAAEAAIGGEGEDAEDREDMEDARDREDAEDGVS